MTAFTESEVEEAALTWLESIGWRIAHGPDISPGGDTLTLALSRRERENYSEVVLAQRLRDALARLNPDLPAGALEDAFRKLTRPEGAELIQRNRALHRLLVDGVTVEYRTADGGIRGAQARVIDFDDPAINDWLAVNQFSVTENLSAGQAGKHSRPACAAKRSGAAGRRPDVVLFVNGLPLAVVELKNAADENATIWSAWQQSQTYQAEVSSLFATNALLAISDGVEARVGTLTAGREWFKPWRTIAGESLADPHLPELQVVIEGLFEKRRFLDLVRDFIVFEDDGGGRVAKKMAGYHRFHAVQVAVRETLRAAELHRAGVRVAESAGRYEAGRKPGGKPGDRRIGVVWHTQGSGKSLTMAFYAGRVIREPAMENPTLVVLTDRNDLDDQLFGTFSRCQDLLRQPPMQAESRAHLRELLAVQAGGVVFTTIHKFFPEEKCDRHPTLSTRRNIVVIADEAHRSQYDFIDGFARHIRDALPHASFIGFTGTPIELADANTRAVFGDYISVYDIQRAVADGATVPIYYESRLARLALDEMERPKIDPDFEEATEGEEVERKEKLKTKWAQLETVVGAEKRLTLVARDIVEQFIRSDRVSIWPPLFYQDELRRRLIITLNILRVVQHVWEAVRQENTERLTPVFDRDHPIRSTRDMHTWYTRKPCQHTERSHINFCVVDSTWEASEEFVVDRYPNVAAWAKNDHLGFEVHYRYQGAIHKYRPDFLTRLKSGEMLILETKGQEDQQSKTKRNFLAEWVMAVNQYGGFGTWKWAVSRHPKDIPKFLY